MLFVTTFIVQNSVIPSASMDDTLLVGDHVFVNKIVFSPVDADAPSRVFAQRAVRRGDVVVFKNPRDPEVDYVKRLVGLPGDVIDIRDKVLFRDGEPADDPHAVLITRLIHDRAESSRDNYGPATVPAEALFVLGDNRDYSSDSREWGFLPRSHVVGRAFFVFWSSEQRLQRVPRTGELLFTRWVSAIRDLHERTRWRRIGTVVH